MSKYKAGDKFIVEIRETIDSDLPQLVGGVNEACYNKRLADAWNAVKKIELNQEAIAKIKEWEDSKEIRRGDEVTIDGKEKGIVIYVDHEEKDGYCNVMYKDRSCGAYSANSLVKTGRNFADKLDALLWEIGGNCEQVD